MTRSAWRRALPVPKARNDGVVVFFKPVVQSDPYLLKASRSLRRDLPKLCAFLDSLRRVQRSVWVTSEPRPDKATAVTLDQRSDVVSFLRTVRQVEHNGRGALGGRYFPASRALA